MMKKLNTNFQVKKLYIKLLNIYKKESLKSKLLESKSLPKMVKDKNLKKCLKKKLFTKSLRLEKEKPLEQKLLKRKQ